MHLAAPAVIDPSVHDVEEEPQIAQVVAHRLSAYGCALGWVSVELRIVDPRVAGDARRVTEILLVLLAGVAAGALNAIGGGARSWRCPLSSRSACHR